MLPHAFTSDRFKSDAGKLVSLRLSCHRFFPDSFGGQRTN